MSGVSVTKKNGGQTSVIFANDTRWRPNSQILHRRDRSNSRVTETARPSGVLSSRAMTSQTVPSQFDLYPGYVLTESGTFFLGQIVDDTAVVIGCWCLGACL